MLTGLSLIPTLTSVVVSMLVSKRSSVDKEEERRFREEQTARLERLEERLARLDAGPPR
jgi:hypothetical protein